MSLENAKKEFGTIADGTVCYLYEITNAQGTKAEITDFGATLVSLYVKDRNGEPVDVVLGYDDAAAYQQNTCYFGATVGRNANRIANATFTIDGVKYELEQNDNENNLHSGSKGTFASVWGVKEQKENSITFTIEDPDLNQGFPGNAVMDVTYTLTEDNGLKIDYKASADKKTTFNMTNHSYFNLNGYASGSVYGQILQLNASGFTPVIDGKAIPTGVVAPVAGTVFDFTVPKKIGQDIEKADQQLIYGTGYDHNYALDRKGEGLETAAIAYAEESGIEMEVLTDLPGIQFYSANFIEGQIGKGGFRHHKREAFCLETQYYPNSINDPAFEGCVVDAGEVYSTTTIYRFKVR